MRCVISLLTLLPLVSAFASTRIVGTHWFTWTDEPLTGRADGECYQVGLVDVVDRPYSEMVAAMRELAKEMYHLDKGKEEL